MHGRFLPKAERPLNDTSGNHPAADPLKRLTHDSIQPAATKRTRASSRQASVIWSWPGSDLSRSNSRPATLTAHARQAVPG